MMQHFNNIFIILLYFILICKEIDSSTVLKILWQHQDVLTFFILKNVMFMTFSQQIISSWLLQVVTGGQKSSLIGKFKLEPIAIYHIWFVMKVL